MNRARIRFTKEAIKQVREVGAWWVEHRPSAPSAFRKELASLIGLLKTSPEMGTPHPHRWIKGVRRSPLETSREIVYYAYDPREGEVLVLAVWSSLRGKPPPLTRP